MIKLEEEKGWYQWKKEGEWKEKERKFKKKNKRLGKKYACSAEEKKGK